MSAAASRLPSASRRREWFTRLVLLAASMVAAPTLVEIGLGLSGSPAVPLVQVADEPNASRVDVSNEFSCRVQTNTQGLRYRDVPLARPPGTVRVFVVGDSYVHGTGVEASERFTERLEQILATPSGRPEYVNGGLTGTGVFEYARLFRWVGLGYEPSGLLLCINANDLGDVRPSHSAALVEQRALRPTGALSRVLGLVWPRLAARLRLARERAEVAAARRLDSDFTVERVARRALEEGIPRHVVEEWRRRIPPAWERAVREKRMPPYLLYWGLFRPDHFTLALDLEGPEAAGLWSIEASLLDAMVETARRARIPVRAVFLPNAFMYDTGPGVALQPFALLGGTVRSAWARETTEIQRRLRAWADARAVPLLDLTPGFRLAALGPERLYYPVDGHWNAAGHRLAADEIARWLADDPAFAPAPSGSRR